MKHVYDDVFAACPRPAPLCGLLLHDGDEFVVAVMQSDCEACRVAAGFNLFVEGKRGPRGEPIADVSPLVEWIPEPLPNADAIMADVAARKALTGPDHVQQPLTYCRVCDGLHLDDGSPACEVPWAAYD